MASHAFGAVQDIVPDREGAISSIATLFGAKATVRFAVVLYALSGLLLMYYGLPTALLVTISLLYISNIWPYRNVTDTGSGRTNRAWRRFIWLNLIAGFCVTMLLIFQFAL